MGGARSGQAHGAALPIIPTYAFGYAVAIELETIEDALETRPELRRYNDDPYGACFQWMLYSLLTHLGTLNDPRPVAVVHEINDYQQSAIATFNYIREAHPLGRLLLSLAFGTKAEFVPLQAAERSPTSRRVAFAFRMDLKDAPYRSLC